MSNAELLAILIRIGVKGSSAVDLGRELMRRFKTRDLVIAGRAMEIRVFDHLITGDGRYFSFADESLIEEYEMQAIL